MAEAESNTPPPPQAVADALLEMLTRESNQYWDPLQPEIRASMERWAAGSWSRLDMDPDRWSPMDTKLADALAVLLLNTDSGAGRLILTEACASPVEAVRLIAEDLVRELDPPS